MEHSIKVFTLFDYHWHYMFYPWDSLNPDNCVSKLFHIRSYKWMNKGMNNN